MQKKILFTILIISTLLFNSKNTYANSSSYEVVYRTGDIYSGDIYYDSSLNLYRINFIPWTVFYYDLKGYHLTDLDNPFIDKSGAAKELGWAYFSHAEMTCDRGYEYDFYDKQRNLVGSYKVIIYDLVDGSCNSGGQGKSFDDLSCGDSLCLCISQLQSTNEKISSSVDSNGETLKIINESVKEVTAEVTAAVNTVSQNIQDFHDEFKTDIDYVPNKLPDVSNLIDENKPNLHINEFKDNTNYFNDQGDVSESPGPMPLIPEPSDNWDGIKKEDDMQPDQKLNKDEELSKEQMQKSPELSKEQMQKSPELSKDQMQKSPELSKDQMQKSPELSKDQMQKSPELSKDQMQKSPELSKDQIQKSPELSKDQMQKSPELSKEQMQKTHDYGKTLQFEKNHIYEQTNVFP